MLSDERARADRRARVLAAVAKRGAPGCVRRAAGCGARAAWLVPQAASPACRFGPRQPALPVSTRRRRADPSPRPPPRPAGEGNAGPASRLPLTTPPPPTPRPSRQCLPLELQPALPNEIASSPPPTSCDPRRPATSPQRRQRPSSPPRARPGPSPAPNPRRRRQRPKPVSHRANGPRRPQRPTRAQAAAGDAANGSSVSELVVTSEKRTSREQSVPVAVSAFTSAQRDVVGSNSVQDADQLRPRALPARNRRACVASRRHRPRQRCEIPR